MYNLNNIYQKFANFDFPLQNVRAYHFRTEVVILASKYCKLHSPVVSILCLQQSLDNYPYKTCWEKNSNIRDYIIII